jgi:hypothetical protein
MRGGSRSETVPAKHSFAGELVTARVGAVFELPAGSALVRWVVE